MKTLFLIIFTTVASVSLYAQSINTNYLKNKKWQINEIYADSIKITDEPLIYEMRYKYFNKQVKLYNINTPNKTLAMIEWEIIGNKMYWWRESELFATFTILYLDADNLIFLNYDYTDDTDVPVEVEYRLTAIK